MITWYECSVKCRANLTRFLNGPRKMQTLFSLIYLVAPFGIGGRNRGTWPGPTARKAGLDLLKDGICDVASGDWFLTFLLMARTRSLACFRLYAEMTTHRYRSCAMRVNRYFSNCTMKTNKPYKVWIKFKVLYIRKKRMVWTAKMNASHVKLDGCCNENLISK